MSPVVTLSGHRMSHGRLLLGEREIGCSMSLPPLGAAPSDLWRAGAQRAGHAADRQPLFAQTV